MVDAGNAIHSATTKRNYILSTGMNQVHVGLLAISPHLRTTGNLGHDQPDPVGGKK